MAYRVVFAEGAQTDIDDLFEWIADHADMVTAQRYIGRIEAYCGVHYLPGARNSTTGLAAGPADYWL